MQVTSLLSLKEPATSHTHLPGESCDQCAGDHLHTNVKLSYTLLGLIFILNSFVIEWIFGGGSSGVIAQPGGTGFVRGHLGAGLSAMIGACILGFPILKVAFQDLKRGRLSINELVALGVLASAANGDFRTAGIVAFFMLLGEIIETRTAAGARASIESLIKLTPTKARRLANGKEEEVPAADLRVADMIRIRPGDNIAADGVITSGQGSVNQANITGESLPVDKSPGDPVFAGTINLNGALDVKVTKAGQDTTLGRVRELILAAEKTRLPFMRIVDQYIGYYTPLILVIAALVWAFSDHDLNRVISILIGACPCAFILATPSAMVAAIASAARLGVLVKNVGDLESAARINAFVFDKTGTLTSGKLVVSRLRPLGETTPAQLLWLAASAEQFSNHPTAKALVQLAEEAGVKLAHATDFSEAAGRGVTARVEGQNVVIGRAAWLRDQGVPDDFLNSVDLNETEGFSLLFVARNGLCVGWIGLQDQTRPEAADALKELREAGVRRIAMVSGDREPVAARVAREIGIEEVVAECLPQNKVEYVKQVKAKGYRVAVVGDGVNDAPALAAGDISIAMGAAGSEVAIHSATIALMNNDLRRLPFLVRLSRLTRRVINQNFLFGIVFVIIVISTGALGYIHPIVAAILHNVGALFVVFNSARLVREGEELEPYHTEPTLPESDPGQPTATLTVSPQAI